MPTYEYACTACSHEWEFEQSIKEDALKECPACHEQTARRQISRGTGFILKGSGWYSDLYSGASNKKGESASASTTTSTTESKPAETKPSGSSDSGSGTSGGGGAAAAA